MKTEELKLFESKSWVFLNQDSEQKEALKLTDQIKTGGVNNETQIVANDPKHLKLSAVQKSTNKYQAFLLRRKIYIKAYRQRQKIKDPPEKVEARRLDNIERQRQYREETKRLKECGQLRKPEDSSEKNEARRLKKNYKNTQYRLCLKQKIDQSKTGLNSEKELTEGGLNNFKKNTYKNRFSSLTPEKKEAFRIKRNNRLRERRRMRNTEYPPEKLKEYRFKKNEEQRKRRLRLKQIEATRDNIVNELKAKKLISQSSLLKKEEIPSVQRKSFELLNQAQERGSDDFKFTAAELRRQKYKQRLSSFTPEQLEAFHTRRKTYQQKYRDRDQSILKKSLKVLKQKRELSAEEREVLILAEKIKDRKSKVLERRKKRLKEIRNVLVKETITHRQNNTKGSGSLMTNHQPSSSFPFVEDEIEIEKKVVQQTLIKAIPKRLTETLNDSSCSWLQPSQESFSTDGTQTSHFRSFHGDSTVSESFLNGSSSHHSNKIERRKTVIDESFSCMRAVIDTTTKGDRFVMFGKHIAQKMRSHKKGEAEINIAKLLIDNVLQNLSIGIYKSEM